MAAPFHLKSTEERRLRSLFLFSALDDAAFSAAVSRCDAPRRLQKGDPVGTPHEAPMLHLLLSGEACVYRLDTAHFPVLLRRLKAGDICGAASLFGGDAEITSVIAQKACVVFDIPESLVRTLLRAYPDIAEQYVRFLTARICFLNRRIRLLTDGQTAARVKEALIACADENGVLHPPDGWLKFAQRLGMSRSSLYRALAQLEQNGWLKTENGQRVICTEMRDEE